MLRTGMKTTKMIDIYKEENTESENHKTKLITEFTPSTGLRLRVPLQLMALKNGTNGSRLCNPISVVWTKSARPLLWTNTNWPSKTKNNQLNRENRQLFTITATGHLQ